MSQTKILLFAALKEAAGKEVLEVNLPPDATVADLLSLLSTQYPELQPWLPHCRVAVDHAYAAAGTVLPPNAEIALIPPVSGG